MCAICLRSERTADMAGRTTKIDISITSHSGVSAEILRLVGHRDYPLPAGGVVPVVIKVITEVLIS
jgi:hypothetical protein